ncbi:MAG: hypothetical protein HOO06_10995 [Bdellovibrionaceae bacterium]|jgi:hypothetical protein|nr:hypothetical protein [Pseudobdellovibrionaceae bacterium]
MNSQCLKIIIFLLLLPLQGCQPVKLDKLSLPKDFGDDTQISLSLSTISISDSLLLSGAATSVTVTIRDTLNNIYTKNSLTIACSISGGVSDGSFSSVTDNQDGTYSLTLTSSTSGTASKVSCSINDQSITSTAPQLTVEFTPLAISGVALWLDASQLNLSNNDSVSSWTDLSGKDNHSEQATAGSQPTFLTGQLNSQPAVSFDGTDDFLQLTTAITMTPATVFIVGRYNASTTMPYMGNDTNNAFIGYAGGSVYYFSTIDNISVTNALPSSYQIYAANAYPTGTDSTISIDGASVVTGDLSLGASSILYIARRNAERFNGDIAEVIIYETNLSTAQVSQVESYLSDKYAITIP